MKRKKTDKKGGIGVWVARIVGVIYILIGLLFILLGFIPGLFGTLLFTEDLIRGVFLVGGALLVIIYGGFYVYLGYSLLKLKNWARIITGLLAGLGLVLGVAQALGGEDINILTMVVDVVIIYFLLLDKKTVRAFK